MKRIPIDKCPAGPELDMAVEKVRGKVACDQWTPVNYPKSGYIKNCQHDDCYPVDYPAQYSRNIAAAWELVDLALEYANDFELQWDGAKEGWMCYITEPAKARTAPLAIARAYLKANDIEFIEVPDD